MAESKWGSDTLEKPPTRRTIQADTTRQKINEIAISLMEQKGFANTTILEISKTAGVSVGTFYNYFSSKEEIFYDIFKKGDEYFEQTVARNLKNRDGSTADQIVLYFKYYARFHLKRGFHNVDQLYSTKTRLFIVKGRFMQELLKTVIEKGQTDGEIVSNMTSDEITDFLFVVARGIVYDWCLHDGKYNLETKMETYYTRMKSVFLQTGFGR